MIPDPSRPADACIHRLFEVQVERAPDAVAVTFGGTRLTYGELNRRANQLAHHLRSLGVGPEVLVALCVERSLDAVVGLLGVLKAGGAYLPVDPTYPRERIAFMLEDAGAPVLLTQARLLPSLPPHMARVVLLDGDREVIARCSDRDPSPAAGPDHLAYVIYTSGSTGRPKGAMLAHRGLTNLARALCGRFEVGPGSRVLQFASLSFDASVWEIAMALVPGATLVMGTREEMLPGPGLIELLRAQEVTMALFPPSVLATFPEGAETALPALRTLIVGGEASPAGLVARWAPGRRFFNAYGPTEVTVISTVAECREAGDAPPIGKAIPNTRCLVLDAGMRPVPDGEAGELYLGGVGLARGYLGQPGLTATRFVPDPFSATPGARLYRTGDLVRRLPGGELAFVGRVDHQVKIRGHRIELGEVEAALERHPAVRAAAVAAREGRLVAYVVARTSELAPQEVAPALQCRLRELLPEPMLPSAFVLLDELPLTPNGKVDRAALPAPEPPRTEKVAESLAPRTAIEATIAAAWASALGLEHIGVDDDVFELGAHSLLVARVLFRLRGSLGVDIPMQRLFEARTVTGLARVVEGLRPEPGTGPAAPITKAPRGTALPLSSWQRQIWLHARLNPGALIYHEPFSIRLPGRLDVVALTHALEEITRRHEAWRTTFVETGGSPAQQIHPPVPLELPLEDLRDEPADARQARAIVLATELARRPFDLERGPLFRFTLVRFSELEHVLFGTVHHIVMDGISLFDVFLPELRALYQALADGRPSPLQELPVQVADYAAWQKARISRAALAPHLDYWKRQLAGAATLELPTDRPRPAIPSHRGSRHCISLSPNLTERLKALSREHGVTLFVVLLSAFHALLHRYTGQDDIAVGTSVSCRDAPEAEGLIGYFLNMLVLRADLSGDPTFSELVRRVGRVSMDALAHRDLPFTTLIETLQPNRIPGQNPLFQVAFILEPPAPELQCGWTLSQLDVDVGAAKFDLTVELDERQDGIIGRIEYSTDLFDARTIQRMAGHYEALLEGVASSADLRLSELPLLTPGERAALREWGVAPPGPGADSCIHRLFEAEVERSPDAIAAIFDDGEGQTASLTYRELNRRANQLAHHLLGLGGKAEDRVAICLYRSLDLIVAILAALKAGLAFVPLDPTYPTDRLAFIVEQARICALITQTHLAGTLPTYQGSVLCLDTEQDVLARERDDNPEGFASPDQLAYVIYTSGSTGQPKGAAIPHRGIARLVKGTNYVRFGASEASLLLSSISFDVAQFEIWGPLLNGGRLVIMPPGPPSLHEIGRVIREQGVTTLLMVAGTFHLLVDEQIEHVRGLQLVIGGEPLSPYHSRRVLSEAPTARLLNAYGPTEATAIASTHHVVEASGYTVPIGRPIPGTRMVVLDAHLREVPIGIPGELYIGGEGIARGYFGRMDLTAERFVPDPTGHEPGGRLYRTGDRVRLRPDGELDFLGRLDHQVKVRGYRIELGEIEVVLGAHPEVRSAVVVAHADRSGTRLVAYVVPRQGEEAPEGLEQALLDHLHMKLPEYMIPWAIVRLSAMPVTSNGKVDRRAFPAPGDVRPARAPLVAPRSQIEERLAAIWQDVLGVECVGVHDNFFDLGGHSLLLMRLQDRIREHFSRNITTLDLFARPTISDLAAFLASATVESDLSEADARVRKQRETLKRKKLAAAQAKSKQHGSA